MPDAPNSSTRCPASMLRVEPAHAEMFARRVAIPPMFETQWAFWNGVLADVAEDSHWRSLLYLLRLPA